MAIEAAIFDLDGTLLESMSIWSNLCNEFLKRHGINEDVDLDGKLGVLSIRNALAYVLQEYSLKLDLDAACRETWAIVENFYRNEVKLKPGVREIIAVLQREKIPAGIITATESGLVSCALERVGLADFFAGNVLSCAELQTSKRSPEVFFMLSGKFNSKPEKTIVFEDALYAGRTAKNAGFKLAAVFDPSEKHPETLAKIADWYCQSWEEFPLHIL
ncbi:MAG: HAD family phosphatase [Lentisphaeria bacterium]|nr:HAD family phosphatase [Lentisphaeria bacterium]